MVFANSLAVGVEPDQLLYTVSMNIRRSEPGYSGKELATGLLDDHLTISFGLNDTTGHFLEVGLEDVLKDHELCEDVFAR